MLLPGFIDIHSHGAGGCDTCDAKLESLRTIAECKMKEGVTSWLPTTLTLSPKVLEDVCASVAEYMKNQEFAKTPGVHLEGPFINPKCCGAQNPAFVRQPDYDEVANLNSIAKVLLVSLAPEMPGAIEFIEKATANGIRCSAGHSAATHEDFNRAKSAGLAHLTHYCNQMSPLHHREIGLVGSGLLDREIKIEIICDTIHLCADMLKTVFKNKDSDQMLMITDSLACSWMPDGPGDLGGLPIIVKDGVARLQESGALAGSTLKYAHGLKNVHRLTVAHAQVHGGVGGGRLRNGVPQFVIRLFLQKLTVLGARTPVFHEGRIKFPGDFRFRDPEGRDAHFMLRSFVRFPVRLFRGTPHEERSSRYGDHAQGSSRRGNRFRVGFKTCRISGSFNELMDLARRADQLPGRQVIRNGKGRTGSAVQFPFLQRGSAFSPLACAGNARGIFRGRAGGIIYFPAPGQQGASSQKAGNKENAAHGMEKTGMPYIVMPPSQAMTCPVM